MALRQGQRQVSIEEPIVRRALIGPYRIGGNEKIVGVYYQEGQELPGSILFLVEKIEDGQEGS